MYFSSPHSLIESDVTMSAQSLSMNLTVDDALGLIVLALGSRAPAISEMQHVS